MQVRFPPLQSISIVVENLDSVVQMEFEEHKHL